MPPTVRDAALQALDSLQHFPHERRRLLVTAGPTCEDIDAVRFLTNRSSGRMGIELAAAAHARGWATLLVLGPTPLPPPAGVATVRVRSAEDMFEAVSTAFAWCEALAMAAAVADYTPADPVRGKIEKGESELVLRLRRTHDILATLADHIERPKKRILGFALQPGMDLGASREKMNRKQLDAIVVNTPSSFGAETIQATLLRADRSRETFGSIEKKDLAQRLLAELLQPA